MPKTGNRSKKNRPSVADLKKVKAVKKRSLEKKPVKQKKEEIDLGKISSKNLGLEEQIENVEEIVSDVKEFLKPVGKTSPVLERVARADEINLEQTVFAAQPKEDGKEDGGINYLNAGRDYFSMGGGRKEEQRKVQYNEISVSYETMIEKKKEEKETRKMMERNIGGEWRERGSTWDMETQQFIRGEKKEEEDTRKYMARGDYK